MKLELVSKHALDSSRATPLLFIHGAWHGAWCWDVHFLDFFADNGFDAHALSLRGHGESGGRERLRWVRIVDYVTDVAWVAAQLPRSPIVIGHSMDGFVVQKYLERHSAPAGMLLASVPPSGILRTVLRFARRHPIAFAKAISSVSLLPIVSTPALARDAFFSDDLGEEEVAAYSARLQDESFLAFFDMLAFDLPQPKRVTTPVFVFGGENDSLFYPDDIKATARAYGRRAQILPGVAHDMMLETKWREVAQCILNALNEVLRDS